MTTRDETAAFLEISEELLTRGCRVRFRADGRSMLPTIRPGEVLWMEPVQPDAVQIGDIILCRTSQRPVAHRVIHVGRNLAGEPIFTLRGDASVEADEPVTSDRVLGRITAVERNGEVIPLTGSAARWHWRLRQLSPAYSPTLALARRLRASALRLA